MNENEENSLLTAVSDLTRVMLALHGNGESRSEMIRRLDSVSIKPARIASLLSIKLNDVTSALHKMRIANKGGKNAKSHP